MICHRCVTQVKKLIHTAYGSMCEDCYKLLYSLSHNGHMTAQTYAKFEKELDRMHGVKRYAKIKLDKNKMKYNYSNKSGTGQRTLI